MFRRVRKCTTIHCHLKILLAVFRFDSDRSRVTSLFLLVCAQLLILITKAIALDQSACVRILHWLVRISYCCQLYNSLGVEKPLLEASRCALEGSQWSQVSDRSMLETQDNVHNTSKTLFPSEAESTSLYSSNAIVQVIIESTVHDDP